MSYHGIGGSASASMSLNASGTSFSSSFGSGGGGGGGGSDHIWDLTCNLGPRGGTKTAVADPSGFTFVCNNGYSCKGGPGKTTACKEPGGSVSVPGPPAPIGPCGSVGARASNAKNGYTYTYCNDDWMYVRDPSGKFQVFSQKEVGGALSAGSAILAKPTTPTSLNMSWLYQPKATAPATLNASSLFSSGPTLASTKMFAAPPPLEVMQEVEKNPREVDCSVPGSCLPSTGAMVGIGLGVLALAGGVFYMVTRSR